MRIHRWLVLAAAAALSGCSVSASTEPNTVVLVNDGTLTLDWSIDGAQDPLVCSDFGADSIDVTVFDDLGGATEFQDSCDVFADTISLAPGDYTAQATLLDANGRDITTTIDIVPFTIVSDTDLSISIDFPQDSFF